VERVLRDERIERERLEREESEQRQLESHQRLAKLKKSTSSDQEKQQHVNLFEPEERAMVETALTTGKHTKPKSASSGGIMPVRLDSVVQKNEDQPFYMRESVVRYDERRKARMDPMKAFVKKDARREEKNDVDQEKNKRHAQEDNDTRHQKSLRKNGHRKRSFRHDDSSDSDSSSTRSSSRRRHDKKRKKKGQKKRHSKSDKHKATAKGDSIQELRRRRQEREEKESQREAALRLEAGTRNDIRRRYQDQFHPSLSRR